MVLGEKLEGFTQCVIPSEKDVGCVCEREREEGGFPPVTGGCGPRVSCFLISTSILFILSPSQIRKDSQEVAPAAEGGSGQGMNVCVRTPEGEMLLRRIYRCYGLGGVILFTSRTLKQEAA